MSVAPPAGMSILIFVALALGYAWSVWLLWRQMHVAAPCDAAPCDAAPPDAAAARHSVLHRLARRWRIRFGIAARHRRPPHARHA